MISKNPNGIIIVTGPTGSGKTTTLYSALRRINTVDMKLLTVEDPVEYDIEGIIQVQANEAIGVTFQRLSARLPPPGTPTLSWWVKSATWRRPRLPSSRR